MKNLVFEYNSGLLPAGLTEINFTLASIKFSVRRVVLKQVSLRYLEQFNSASASLDNIATIYVQIVSAPTTQLVDIVGSITLPSGVSFAQSDVITVYSRGNVYDRSVRREISTSSITSVVVKIKFINSTSLNDVVQAHFALFWDEIN